MSIENLFQKFERKKEEFIDNLIYGKDEDRWVRYARKRDFREKYGNPFIAAWTPGLIAYVNIRDYLRNSKFTKKEKAVLCITAVGCELILDVVKVGGIYLCYKLTKYLFF